MERRVGSFVAVDVAGNQNTVFLFQKVLQVRSFEGVASVPGMGSMRLANGESVSRVEKGMYVIDSSPGPINLDRSKCP